MFSGANATRPNDSTGCLLRCAASSCRPVSGDDGSSVTAVLTYRLRVGYIAKSPLVKKKVLIYFSLSATLEGI